MSMSVGCVIVFFAMHRHRIGPSKTLCRTLQMTNLQDFHLNVHSIKKLAFSVFFLRQSVLVGHQDIWWSCVVSPHVSLWFPSEKFLMKLIYGNLSGAKAAAEALNVF